MKLKNILDGWRNFMDKSEVTERIAVERAKICFGCKHAKKGTLLSFVKDNIKEVEGYKCNKCQCPLSAKIRSVNEKCPIKLWS